MPLQLLQPWCDDFEIVRIGVAGMRRADDVRDPFPGCIVGHLEGGFEIRGTVIYTVNQVVMYIDH
jgi:hypothetical protein